MERSSRKDIVAKCFSSEKAEEELFITHTLSPEEIVSADENFKSDFVKDLFGKSRGKLSEREIELL